MDKVYSHNMLYLDDDKSQIEVKLVWPWKEHVTIEYIAKAVSGIELFVS